MTRRILIIALLLMIIVAGVIGWKYYGWIYHPNTTDDPTDSVVLVQSQTSLDALTKQLISQNILLNKKAFKWVARRMKFGDAAVIEGRYHIEPGLSNYDLIQKLRLGVQEPIPLVIRFARDIQDVTGRICRQLFIDSIQLMQELNHVFIPATDYTEETILSLMIPNTYEVYWTISPAQLLKRMETEHARFWKDRSALAQELGLNEMEVYTLASIVERETQANEEKATIAGVYLNRIERNMMLQADPTVLFALGDYTIRRVLTKHLQVDSPYNTYRHLGLPPGPIAMPSIASIDAILQPEDHNYIFFCAKPGNGGHHSFATNLTGHMKNARAYQRWLNAEGIR